MQLARWKPGETTTCTQCAMRGYDIITNPDEDESEVEHEILLNATTPEEYFESVFALFPELNTENSNPNEATLQNEPEIEEEPEQSFH